MCYVGLQALEPENLLWITMIQEATTDVANRCSDAQQYITQGVTRTADQKGKLFRITY